MSISNRLTILNLIENATQKNIPISDLDEVIGLDNLSDSILVNKLLILLYVYNNSDLICQSKLFSANFICKLIKTNINIINIMPKCRYWNFNLLVASEKAAIKKIFNLATPNLCSEMIDNFFALKLVDPMSDIVYTVSKYIIKNNQVHNERNYFYYPEAPHYVNEIVVSHAIIGDPFVVHNRPITESDRDQIKILCKYFLPAVTITKYETDYNYYDYSFRNFWINELQCIYSKQILSLEKIFCYFSEILDYNFYRYVAENYVSMADIDLIPDIYITDAVKRELLMNIKY
jgi:hypothetical protein